MTTTPFVAFRSTSTDQSDYFEPITGLKNAAGMFPSRHDLKIPLNSQVARFEVELRQ